MIGKDGDRNGGWWSRGKEGLKRVTGKVWFYTTVILRHADKPR